MKRIMALALAAIGVLAGARAGWADDQRVDLVGEPGGLMECGQSWSFLNGPFAAAPAWKIPDGQQFVLTDAEWTAQGINPGDEQELVIDTLLFPPLRYRLPFLIAPATTVMGQRAYGQVHLQTGIVFTGGVCGRVSSGEPVHIYLQGYLEPAGGE